MCSKPDPAEVHRDLSRLMITLYNVTGNPTPAHDYGWAGIRTHYGLLENC